MMMMFSQCSWECQLSPVIVGSAILMTVVFVLLLRSRR